ncbi:MAG TPA: PAS domain S-box protein [Candidatus Ozemobacteraceae bacterium]|nr:PAS domain S-box protein [Candidatus Ozemobacteraceae bacterium]
MTQQRSREKDVASLEREIESLRTRVKELEQEHHEVSRQTWSSLSLHAIESLHDMVFWTRPDMTIEYVNESACRVLEYSRVELLRMTVSDLDPNIHPERWGPYWERLRQDGFIRLETTQRTKSGRLIPVEVLATFLTIEGQELSCTVIREIADRRKAEDDLRASEARFRTLFLNMAEGVALHRIVHDDRGAMVNYEILDVNPRYEEILGIKRADVIGRTGTEVYGTTQPPYLSEFGSVAMTGVPYVFETYFAPFDKHFQISVVSPGKGFFCTIFFDVSSHKRLEQELRDRLLALTQPVGTVGTLRFEDLFGVEDLQSLQDSLALSCGVTAVLTQPDGTLITRVSLPSGENALPVERREVRELRPGDVWKTDPALPVPNLKEPVLRPEGGTEPKEAAVGFWVEERLLATWFLFPGSRRGLRNRQAVERLNSAARAFFLVAQRLSQLALQNRQQVGAILQLEKTEERIRRLNVEWMGKNAELENVVHAAANDLHGPLMNVRGFTEQIRKTAGEAVAESQTVPVDKQRMRHLNELLEERIPRSIAFIHTDVNKMETLIGGLLRFSQLGWVRIHLERLDARKLVEQVLQSMSATIQGVRASVQIENLPDCHADAEQMREVFSIFFENAVKYRHGYRPLKIRVFGRVEGQMTTFGVEDNGLGIKPEQQPRVWDFFQRLRQRDESRGDGMGLTLVRRIIDRHHGSVFVESDGANGSTFYFKIPLVQETVHD